MIKDGKLFGKINVIDFIVILVVILAIAAAAVFIFMPKDGADTLVMKFRIEEVDEFVAGKVKVGDPLYDDTYSLDLGFVTDIEIDDSISYSNADSDNIWTIASKEGYKSMIITGECKGTKTNLGAEIGGKKYGVGHSFVLRAGDAKLYLRVYDIELKDGKTEENTAKTEETAAAKTVTYTLYAPEVENFIANKLSSGDTVVDLSKKNTVGKVTSAVLGDSESYDAYNRLAPKEGYKSITVFCEGTAYEKEDGLYSDGKKIYRIGDEISVSVGDARLTVKISAIDVSDEETEIADGDEIEKAA